MRGGRKDRQGADGVAVKTLARAVAGGADRAAATTAALQAALAATGAELAAVDLVADGLVVYRASLERGKSVVTTAEPTEQVPEGRPAKVLATGQPAVGSGCAHVPILVEGAAAGVLSTRWVGVRRPGAARVAALEEVAAYLAVAVAHLSLRAEAERRAREQTVIADTTAAIAAAPDLDMALRALLNGVRELTNAEAGAVRVSPTPGELGPTRVYRWLGGDQYTWHDGENLPRSVTAEVLADGRGRNVPDLAVLTAAGYDGSGLALKNYGIRSSLVVPLRAAGVITGTLHANSWRVGAFREQQIASLQVLADHAGSAIERVRVLDEMRAEVERRAAAETALRESEARYRAVVEYSADGIVIGIGTRLVLANRAFAEIVGAPDVPEVLRARMTDFLVPEDGELVVDRGARRQRGESVPDRYEVRVLRPSGEIRTVELGAALVPHSEGPATLAVVRDVTESRTAASELARLLAAERQARAEAELLADLAAALAEASRPAEVLEAAVGVLPRMLGTAFGVITLPDADGVLRHAAVRGMDEEIARRYAFRPGEGYIGRAFADGRPQLAEDLFGDPATHQPDLDALCGERAFLAVPLIAHGQVLGVIAVGSPTPGALGQRDLEVVTAVARHTAIALAAAEAREAAQREAGEKAAILEQMVDAVIVVDAHHRVRLANRAASAFFGIDLNTLRGLRMHSQSWNVFDEDGQPVPVERRQLNLALKGEEVPPREYRTVFADGRERWSSAASAPLRAPDGSVTGAVLLVRDTTERRAAEQRSVQSEKLRLLGQMAGGIAHDLNQALALVAGYGELARRALDAPMPDPAVARDMLDTVTQAAMDGGAAVQRLLVFTRDRDEGPLERVELGPLLEEVARLTAPRWRDAAQAEGRPIALQVEAEADTAVLGHPSSLRQALTNLVLNAVDALPEGGQVRLGARGRGGSVEISVADTGVGMPEDVRRRAFEPFYSTKGDRGTGLGLAQVLAIAEKHGGRVGLSSAPGQGTTVTVVLPPPPTTKPADPPAATAMPAARPLRVLAVDDEPLLAKVVALALREDGHAVEVACSAVEALAHLENGAFDVLVSDLSLGDGMNGWQLAERAKALRPELSVVLVTGWGASIDREMARSRHADAVVAKPFRRDDLRRALADCAL